MDLTEVLKDCLKGTKFYSRFLGSVEFYNITSDNYIEVMDKNECHIEFKPNGTYKHSEENAEIDLFPSKDQRDWSKWHSPFVKGDILVSEKGNIVLCSHIDEEQVVHFHCILNFWGNFEIYNGTGVGYSYNCNLANDSQKQRLFDALKKEGYEWDDTTKTLKKLIEPKFKVGDIITTKNGLQTYKITGVTSEYYSSKIQGNDCVEVLPVKNQDDWILIPNKFDYKTLQPFDKVLVRQYDVSTWCADFYSYYDEFGGYAEYTGGVHYNFCIPYNEDTKHLVGKSEDAPDFYRYWED